MEAENAPLGGLGTSETQVLNIRILITPDQVLEFQTDNQIIHDSTNPSMFRTWMLDNAFPSWCRVCAALSSPCHRVLPGPCYHLSQFITLTRNLPLVLARIWADGKSLVGPEDGWSVSWQSWPNLPQPGQWGKVPRIRGCDETIPQTNLRIQQQETFIEYKLDCYYSVRCNTACRRNILVFSSINCPCC